MTSPTSDRRQGLVGNTPIKAPVACATSGNIVLSGEQMIGGFQTSASRVLVWQQTDPTQNGIYDTSSAAWTRSNDADGNYDLTKGTIVLVTDGTYTGLFFRLITSAPITVGTSAINFVLSTPISSLYVLSTDYPNLQAAVTAAAGKTLRVIGAYAVTAAVAVLSNTTIIFDASSTVTTATPEISVFDATGTSNVHLQGFGKISSTANTGVASHVGLVNFTNATDCDVSGLELVGPQWAAVLMSGSTNCWAYNCRIHDFLAAVQDCAGVQILDGSVNCGVHGGYIKNAGFHGVNVQETGGGLTPVKTKISEVDISACKVYGVNCYNKTVSANQHTQIIGCTISDVQGGAPYNTSGGTGVYIQNAGGCRVADNTIRNCCLATSDNSLTAGGIGINNVNSPLIKPHIEGNTISEIGITSAGVQNPNAITVAAIYLTSSTSGVTVGPNTISQQVTTTAPLGYTGIYVNGVSVVSITDGSIDVATTVANSQGIFVYANGLNIDTISIVGGTITGCDFAHIRFDQVGGFHVSQSNVVGVVTKGGSANCIPLRISQAQSITVSNVSGSANTVAALALSASTNCIFSGGRFVSSGTQDITTSGACTGSFIDETVLYGSDAKITNAGTGCTIKTRSNAAPAAGTWAVGDIREQSTPVVGNPKRWRCTVAGAPGTWVSEGNL